MYINSSICWIFNSSHCPTHSSFKFTIHPYSTVDAVWWHQRFKDYTVHRWLHWMVKQGFHCTISLEWQYIQCTVFQPNTNHFFTQDSHYTTYTTMKKEVKQCTIYGSACQKVYKWQWCKDTDLLLEREMKVLQVHSLHPLVLWSTLFSHTGAIKSVTGHCMMTGTKRMDVSTYWGQNIM